MNMHRKLILFCLTAALLPAATPDVVKVDTGRVKGVVNNGVAAFKGVPFAAPPVGALRWKAPQPAPDWKGVREAAEFGPRCMQGNIYGDMIFRDKGPSEDCLYLNVWTPATSAKAHLPVMVWVYGGGTQGRRRGQHELPPECIWILLACRTGQGVGPRFLRQLWSA